MAAERCRPRLCKRALARDVREITVARAIEDALTRHRARCRCELALERGRSDQIVADEDEIVCGDRSAHRRIAGDTVVEGESRPLFPDYRKIAAGTPDLLAQRFGAEQRAVEKPGPVERSE